MGKVQGEIECGSVRTKGLEDNTSDARRNGNQLGVDGINLILGRNRSSPSHDYISP